MKTQEKTLEFLNSLGLDIDFQVADLENVTDFDSLYDALQSSQLLDVEIIYYSQAIDFLKENDPSLDDSLAIADEMGFELKNLSSATLASLLASNRLNADLSEKRDEINEFFEELEAAHLEDIDNHLKIKP